MTNAPAPLLVIGWGNPSRGDDALGPMLVERLLDHAQAVGASGRLEGLTDFQLQVEHALDLVGRERVLFVDAATDLPGAFAVRPLHAARGGGIGSHALAPEAVLQVYQDLHQRPPPPSTLLAIGARAFELGEPPGAEELVHLELALQWAGAWMEARTPMEEVIA